MMPALRRKALCEQTAEIVAVQLPLVVRVDVVPRIAVKAPVGRGHQQQPFGREHACELGQHRELVLGGQVLDRLERYDDVDRGAG